VSENLGVSAVYVAIAQRLTPAQRQMVREGRVGLNRIKSSARRARSNGVALIDDITLAEMVRVAGIERVLTVASAVEREQLHQ
jgi:hypothetical protein